MEKPIIDKSNKAENRPYKSSFAQKKRSSPRTEVLNEKTNEKKPYHRHNKKNQDTSSSKTTKPSTDGQKHNNHRYNNEEKTLYKKNTPPTETLIFAHCKICTTGISNEAYAIKIGEDSYIHFECALKKLKEIGQKQFNYGNRLKYSYIGSNTFAIYLEQGGNTYTWKILQKVKLEELLPLELKALIEKK